MLGVPESRVAGAQELDRLAGGILRGDQVDAAILPPFVVGDGVIEELDGLLGVVAGGLGVLLHQELIVEDGPGKGRRVHPHMVGGDAGLELPAADVHGDLLEVQDVAVDVGHANGPLGGGIQDGGEETFALGLVVGDHGAGGHEAHQLFTLVDGHAAADNAPVQQRDGPDAAGQGVEGLGGEVPVQNALVGRGLRFQSLAAHVVPLRLGEGHGEPGQGHGEDGHGLALGVETHLVAVEGHPGLQAQGVPGAQARGLRAQFQQTVPQPVGVLRLHEHLVAQGFAGVTGLGHPGLVPFEGQHAQGVLHGLRHGHAAGEDHQQVTALGALNGDGGVVRGDVGDLHVELLGDGEQVGKVLVRVGGVDHQEVPVLEEPIEVGVVHGAAVLVGDDAVLGFVHVQGQHVAGQHVLQEGDRVGALHPQPPHVTHVEEAAAVAGEQVLGDDALRVLDGHLPAAEVHHGGARRKVGVVELGPFELAHKNPPTVFVGYSVRAIGADKQKRRTTTKSTSRLRSLPERFPERNLFRAPRVRLHLRREGRSPHFPELRPGPILLPESFCCPLRRRQ